MNKSLPAPNVPGSTEAERMDDALRKILNIEGRPAEGRGEVETDAGTEETGEDRLTTSLCASYCPCRRLSVPCWPCPTSAFHASL